MKNMINQVVAKVSFMSLCPDDICGSHDLSALGVNDALSVVVEIEERLKLPLADWKIPYSVWKDWRTVGDIYKHYGVEL